MNNPEANFDALYLLDSLSSTYRELHVSEIEALCYLAQLLSTYDGNPLANWGYHFVHHRFGGPFCAELRGVLENLSRAGFLADVDGRQERFRLLTPGHELAVELKRHHRLGWRTPYLAACTDAALNRPLPAAIRAIRNEPMLSSSTKAERTEVLGEGLSVEILYDQFQALKEVLGADVKDLWIAALLWLDYLKGSEEGKAEHPHGN